jgi:choline-sulfatase
MSNEMERPNILFLFPDQWRADWFGDLPGLDVRQPFLDNLKRKGVSFQRAYTPSPLCAPARACLATGLAYGEAGVANNQEDLPPGSRTFYQGLRDRGYRVGGYGKFDLHKATPSWGLDGTGSLEAWGFTDGCDNEGKWDGVATGRNAPSGPYAAYLHREGLMEAHAADMGRRGGSRGYGATHSTPLPESAYCDNWIGAQARDWLAELPADAPWFLQVNFAGPHDPMDVTAAMKASVDGRRMPAPVSPDDRFDLATHRDIRRNYTAMTENIDRLCDNLWQQVVARGEADRTWIVFASDHGEMLGDYGRWAKALPHEASVRIPLVVVGPGVAARAPVPSLTLLQDLTSTFLDLAGAEFLPGSCGKSLLPELTGGSDEPRHTSVRTAYVDGGWECEITPTEKTVHWNQGAGRQTSRYSVGPDLVDPGL